MTFQEARLFMIEKFPVKNLELRPEVWEYISQFAKISHDAGFEAGVREAARVAKVAQYKGRYESFDTYFVDLCGMYQVHQDSILSLLNEKKAE